MLQACKLFFSARYHFPDGLDNDQHQDDKQIWERFNEFQVDLAVKLQVNGDGIGKSVKQRA